MRQPELGAFLAAFGLSPAALEGRGDAKRRRLAGRRLRLGSLGSLTFGGRARGGLAPHAEGARAGPPLPYRVPYTDPIPKPTYPVLSLPS